MIYQVEKVLRSSKVLSILSQVDPKKKVEIGSFRISGDGTQEGRKLVSASLVKVLKVNPLTYQIPYARSNEHLSEVVDTVCKNFEDYAQATAKASGEPTIIRSCTFDYCHLAIFHSTFESNDLT